MIPIPRSRSRPAAPEQATPAPIPRRARGALFLLPVITVLLFLPGCATMMLLNSGISAVNEIPTTLSKSSLQGKFGTPASSGTTHLGRPTETYRIRQRVMKEDATKLLADLLTGCMIPIHPIPLACLTMAVFDVVAFPFAVRESNRNKLSVTFVYGNDDHVLYYYVADADPASRYRQALSTLTHPFARETELAKCSSAKDCVERYMEEARMRASEVEHELLPEQEREFQESLEIAKELDEHRITREQALMRWWGRRLGL